MNGFFQKTRTTGLESELVRQRPVPRDEFVVTLARQIDGRSQRRRGRRVGAVMATAGVALVALGASGGSGSAYSSASTAVRKIASAVNLNQSGRIKRPTSSIRAQYGSVPVPPTPTTPGTKPSTAGGNKPTSGGNTFRPPSKQKRGV